MQASATATQDALGRVYHRLCWRLMPLFCVCIVLNYLDRTSLSFASIQMTAQLGLSPETLGLGGGIFFVTYCLMQVPSNIICVRVGVRRWLSAIMLCWGAVAALLAAVRARWQFFLLRALLGLAESGSFPAVWYGVSLWFPPSRVAVPYALMNAAVSFSQVAAGPIAAGLLKLDGLGGLAGWQWVFLGEGIPSMALAMLLPFLLPEGPTAGSACRWLSQEEQQLLQQDREAASKQQQQQQEHKAPARPTPATPAPDCNDPEDPPSVFLLHLSNSRSDAAAQADGTSAEAAQADGTSAEAAPAAAAAAAAGGGGAPHARPLSSSAQQRDRSATGVDWQLLLQVVRIWQIWFLAVTEAVKVMAVTALMLWLPFMIHSLTSGADPTQVADSRNRSTAQHDAAHSTTGTVAVLLSAIPFTCSAVLSVLLGSLAQRTGRPLVYGCTLNLIGGAAFLAFPALVHVNRALGFVMLTVALACAHASGAFPLTALSHIVDDSLKQQQQKQQQGEEGEQDRSRLLGGEAAASSGDTAGAAVATPQGTALALPLYNSVAMFGGFFGPWILGLAVEKRGGFSTGSLVLGLGMLVSGTAVLLLYCLHPPTARAGAPSPVEAVDYALELSMLAGADSIAGSAGGPGSLREASSRQVLNSGGSWAGSRGSGGGRRGSALSAAAGGGLFASSREHSEIPGGAASVAGQATRLFLHDVEARRGNEAEGSGWGLREGSGSFWGQRQRSRQALHRPHLDG